MPSMQLIATVWSAPSVESSSAVTAQFQGDASIVRVWPVPSRWTRSDVPPETVRSPKLEFHTRAHQTIVCTSKKSAKPIIDSPRHMVTAVSVGLAVCRAGVVGPEHVHPVRPCPVQHVR